MIAWRFSHQKGHKSVEDINIGQCMETLGFKGGESTTGVKEIVRI